MPPWQPRSTRTASRCKVSRRAGSTPRHNATAASNLPTIPDENMPETPEAQVTELLELAEQLQTANAQLAAANEDLLRQVAQFADPLISFGAGVNRAVLNARSIRGMSLRELTEVDGLGVTQYKGTYGVMIDDLRVTEYLPPDQAQRELAQAEKIWRQALQPPD